MRKMKFKKKKQERMSKMEETATSRIARSDVERGTENDRDRIEKKGETGWYFLLLVDTFGWEASQREWMSREWEGKKGHHFIFSEWDLYYSNFWVPAVGEVLHTMDIIESHLSTWFTPYNLSLSISMLSTFAVFIRHVGIYVYLYAFHFASVYLNEW